MKKVTHTPGKNLQRTQQLQQQRRMQQNRKADVKEDVADAKEANVSTLGGSKRAEKKKTEAPKEKVTITSARTEEKKETKESQEDAVKVENQVESAPKEKNSEDLKMDFINSFADNLDEKSATEIGKRTASSLAEIAQNGGGQVESEPVLAAHTRNYAKQILNEKMPNASAAEIREAAKSDPEIAKAVKLMDASSAYMKKVVQEKKGDAKPAAPGDSDIGGPPQGGPQPGVDPFAAHKASSQQPPSDGDGTSPPQDGEGPKSPYHLPPEQQAQMMAENHQSMLEVSKIYQQMFADMQKAAAERFKIMQETQISINEIMMGLYHKRQASFAKHNAAVLTMLTDSWG